MTRVPVAIKPTHDVPLSVAVEEITGFETLGIEKRYGRKMEELGGTTLLMGVVWVYENRGDKKTSWSAIEARTLRELNGYFPAEPVDADTNEPDSDLGKESAPVSKKTNA